LYWQLSHRADKAALAMADRHYNRQKPGSPQFVPPGRCLVLITPERDALWVTSWPFGEYVKHRWPGAWVCSLFRNESGRVLSSLLIREALAATRWYFGDNPLGMVTFVDTAKTRHKRDPGRCYLRAGFHYDGYTQGGLVALACRPENMPPAAAPFGIQTVMEVGV
jgi:hypothetical protein